MIRCLLTSFITGFVICYAYNANLSKVAKDVKACKDYLNALIEEKRDLYDQLKAAELKINTIKNGSVIESALRRQREKELNLYKSIVEQKYKLHLTFDDVKHIEIPPFTIDGWHSYQGSAKTIEDLFNECQDRIRKELENKND